MLIFRYFNLSYFILVYSCLFLFYCILVALVRLGLGMGLGSFLILI